MDAGNEMTLATGRGIGIGIGVIVAGIDIADRAIVSSPSIFAVVIILD